MESMNIKSIKWAGIVFSIFIMLACLSGCGKKGELERPKYFIQTNMNNN